MKKEQIMMGLKMNIAMGVTLSFFLSLQGNLLSGHFTLSAWLISFVVSVLVSFVVCLIVPMRKVTDVVIQKSKLNPVSIPCRALVTLVSDCIFTPIMTFLMVLMAYKSAVKQGAEMPFGPMFLKSLILSMLTGFILIFILQPIFLKKFCPIHEPCGPGYSKGDE
ncbi:MAG: hypothetical protein IKS48_06440 [Eubacterium sp.]|nr:hypothetical protein [Eubacterium sp.]